MHSLHALGHACMQTAAGKKREELPTEKERGDPSSSRRALEKFKNFNATSKAEINLGNLFAFNKYF